jgi:hypothetical protein
MRYLSALVAGTLLTGILYFLPVFLLFPSPISAEYWIREMMVIKKSIASTYKGKIKIIVLSGSSALFSIDTNAMSQELGMPVINYGLMGGLPLETLFNEMFEVAERGDILILPLEPDAYCKEEIEGYREFEIRNAIAWNYGFWKGLSLRDKLLSLRFVSSKFPLEIVEARFTQIFKPTSITARLNALNDDLILQVFNDPKKDINVNLYSIYNVDSLGNIKNTADSSYKGSPRRADLEIKICDKSLKKIIAFKKIMDKSGVQIYFANAPFVELDDLSLKSIMMADNKFKKTLSNVAPVLDSRSDLLFPISSFLNTELHLNSIGRAARTNMLIESMQKNNVTKNDTQHQQGH